MRYPNITSGVEGFLHGGDYNPDQWEPALWDEDMELMKKARCNAATVGIFAWAKIEPEEGVFDFDCLDAVLDKLAANGIRAVLATPTAAPPAWLAEKHPETLRVKNDGRERSWCEGRVNYCPSSPVYAEKCAVVTRKLAERYREHPALAVWHVHNEYGGGCTCGLCREAFRRWLKRKYGDLDSLNRAYWTAFWSQTYQSWEQIHPFNGVLMGLQLDWKRFVSDQVLACFENEARILREVTPEVPVTTNSYGFFVDYDPRPWAEAMDVIAWDCYPQYHARPEMWKRAMATSFELDFARCLKGDRPFMLMETTPSSTNWMPVEKLKRPGTHRLFALQAVSHGADSVQYFQWRAGLGGAEKFHGAVVDHSGRSDRRVFGDVADLGTLLEKIAGVTGTPVRSDTAVIFDKQNRWAIEGARGPRSEKRDYDVTCRSFYSWFWRHGVSCDVVDADADISGYRLVFAPMLYMVRPGVAQRLEDFVRNGGTLVTTYWSGIADENDKCFYGGRPGPLKELLGIDSEELDVLYDDETVPVTVDSRSFPALNGTYSARIFCDLVNVTGGKAQEAPEVLGKYSGEFYAGRPALTVKRSGEGRAFYAAFRDGGDFAERLCACLAEDMNITPAAEAELPEGVTLRSRTDGETDYLFVLNFTGESRTVEFKTPPGVNLSDGSRPGNSVEIGPYGSEVFKVSHA
ncbi:MAG: beta-galactosidase [Kiritimatiellia bacterium]